MKVAQIGLGSMGKRRLRCLRANGVAELMGFDKSERRRNQAREMFDIPTAADLSDLLGWNPDAFVISVPGRHHMEYLLEGARAGKHLFVEVPTALRREGFEEVRRLTRERNLVFAQGCQLFFHPDTQAFRSAVTAPSFGRILAASYTMGTFLPDWHPYEKIGDFYASDIALGGGNLDVVFQELIWLNELVGSSMKNASFRSGRSSGLPLAPGTPDHIELAIEYENGVMMSLHFDLVDRTHEGYVRFAGERQTAVWSKVAYGRALLFDAKEKRWEDIPKAEGYDYEQAYVAETGHWLACVRGEATWPVSSEAAERLVGLIELLASGESDGRIIALGGAVDG